MKQYAETGKVVLVWRDFAWIGEESRQAAQAARCAGQQGQFWAYHDHLYRNQRGENQGAFAPANLKAFAAALKLDTAAFNVCLDAGADLPKIQAELREARGRGVNSTPFISLNGQRLPASTFAQLQPLIDAELAKPRS